MNSGGRFGNTLRDDIFQFRLDNETGSTLTVTNVGSTYTVSLLSKNGDDLGHGSFNIGGTTALSTVVLDSTNKRLVFTLADGSVLYCELTALYALIDTKQNTLGINPTTTTDNLTGLTINGTSYAIKSEPDAYIKDAAVTNEKLTLTKKDDTTVELDVSGKVDKPNEPVQGLGVNVPYYFSVDYSADKATVTDYTIDLLNKTKDPQTFTLDINPATTTTAGLESAADKSKLDAIESGAQVNKIETIKVNGTEQTITDKSVDITIPDQLDTNVKLSTQLKTYYNIGKVQTASGTNPVVIGNAGDSIRDVLNNLTQMDEIQPTITSQPSISTLTISSNASDEIGTSISDVSYSLSTSAGTYEFGPATGVTFSKYTFAEGSSSTEKTTTSGTLTLSTPYVVGTSSAVSFTCTGEHTEGVVAQTNLGNPSNPEVKIASGTKSKNATFSKTSVTYAYTNVTSSTTAPTAGTKRTSIPTFASSGASLSYNSGDYIYFYTEGTGKTVETNVLGQWATVPTTSIGIVTLTLANSATHEYDCYRIGPFGESGTDTYRV